VNAWIVALGTLLAALPVAWPRAGRSPWPRRRRWRLRRLLGQGGRQTPSDRPAARAFPAFSRPHARLGASLVLAAVVALAAIVGGPVAAVIAACYVVVGARSVQQRDRRRQEAARRREQLDHLEAAAADLRAGLPVSSVLPAKPDERGQRAARVDALTSRVAAAINLAERTGAPLAELLERVEADARAADRARGAAMAQAAGAVATAWLLAGLPAGGIALGYAIGTDPLGILLHTPIGAACAFGATVLQLAGLAWSRRIIRVDGAAP
jgi:tight adherence protein B